MFWIKFSLLKISPHHGFVLNLLHDLIFWRRRRRRTWRTSSRPKRLRWRRRMILMMVEATKSYIWFGGPYKALNHPKSSSRNPCGPNCRLAPHPLPPSSAQSPSSSSSSSPTTTRYLIQNLCSDAIHQGVSCYCNESKSIYLSN